MAEENFKMKVMAMAIRSLCGGDFEVRVDREKKEIIFVRDEGDEVMTFDDIADSIEAMFKDE